MQISLNASIIAYGPSVAWEIYSFGTKCAKKMNLGYVDDYFIDCNNSIV